MLMMITMMVMVIMMMIMMVMMIMKTMMAMTLMMVLIIIMVTKTSMIIKRSVMITTTTIIKMMTIMMIAHQEPMTTTSGEVVTVTASFTNPGSIPLTNCTFNMEGNLKVAKDDTNKLEFEPLYWKDYGSWNMAVG